MRGMQHTTDKFTPSHRRWRHDANREYDRRYDVDGRAQRSVEDVGAGSRAPSQDESRVERRFSYVRALAVALTLVVSAGTSSTSAFQEAEITAPSREVTRFALPAKDDLAEVWPVERDRFAAKLRSAFGISKSTAVEFAGWILEAAERQHLMGKPPLPSAARNNVRHRRRQPHAPPPRGHPPRAQTRAFVRPVTSPTRRPQEASSEAPRRPPRRSTSMIAFRWTRSAS